MTDEYESIGKMTFVPKGYKDRSHGWFYRRAGIGRLMEPPEPFDTYKRSIPDYYGYHLFDKVHMVMCIEQGIIPKEIGVQLLRTLKEMEGEGIDKARHEAGGEAHSGEAYLIQKLGWDTGGYIHAGRSSNDLAPTYDRVMQRDALLDVMDAVNALRETLLDLSEKHVETTVPEYTALQHARVSTLGYYFMSLVNMLERDFERLELCYKHTNISTMGSADGTGSDFPINPFRTAELAGFDGVFDNGLDVYHGYDIRAEAFADLGMVNDVVARLGETLLLWASQEFRMADIADRYCGTSSIMSQKKNPNVGTLATTRAAVRHLELLDEGSRLVRGSGNFRYFDEAVRNTVNNINYARGILKTTTFNIERMRELCNYGFMCNADLCRILVQRKGLPWRTAHQITATMTRLAVQESKEMADVTPELLDRAAEEYVNYGKPLDLDMETLRETFDIDRSLRSLKSHGGAAPERVEEQMATSRKRLNEDRARVENKREKLKAVAEKLERVIDDIISK